MAINFTTRDSGNPGQAPILVLTGSATGQLRITMNAGVPQVTLDGVVQATPAGLLVSGYDATAVSGVTLTAVADGADSYLTFATGDGTVTGGAGADIFLAARSSPGATNLITDFGYDDSLAFPYPIRLVSQSGGGFRIADGELQVDRVSSSLTRLFLGADNINGAEYSVSLQGDYEPYAFAVSAQTGRLVYLPGTNQQGGAGNDVLTGTGNRDTLFGSDGNDTLIGLQGDDLLQGGAGDDVLRPGDHGNDTVDGGTGLDTLELPASGFALNAHVDASGLLLGVDIQVFGQPDRLITTTGVERIVIGDAIYRYAYATTGNDRIGGEAGAVNRLWGGPGADHLTGGNLADELYGGDGADSLYGGAGEDTLTGGKGNDLLNGGAGDDLAVFSYADATAGLSIAVDTLNVRAGTQEVDWLISIDRINITGSAFNDTITGSSRRETLSGGAGDDVIRGGGGDDVIAGGTGSNTLWGGVGSDQFMVGGMGSTNLVMDFTVNDRLSLLRADGAGTLAVTSYAAGSGDGLGLGAVRYQDLGNGLVRLHVGADNIAGADYTVDLAGLGTGARLARTDFQMPHILQLSGYSTNSGTANADYFTGTTVMRGGGAGNDLYQGSAGVQAVVMGASFADISIQNHGNGAFQIVDSRATGGGVDTLYDVELLILSDRVVQLAEPQLLSSVGSTRVDEAWYLSNNPDIAEAVAAGWISSGADHYARYGQAEGRQPNLLSDNQGKAYSESAYLAANPDIRDAVAKGWFDSGYDHYLAYGRAEGRAAYPSQSLLRLGFDEAAYLAANPDIALSVSRGEYANGYEHYARFGAAEGRNPNAFFDATWYLARNSDVAAGIAQGKVASAVDHYMLYGWREGRDPSAYFDTSAYLDRNTDVAAAGMNPLLHFLGWGQAEGRIATVADLSLLG
ncbi:calcium-binding protein [Niveispirillum cyanobacteriorum]|uniref:Uncharacterized protein n=1 Tax=Niveispirillum cyanobacteriorum TaxID=1612173 RepID=A0A2K9N9P7_9PROT|nr:calcium-binding protein [Niveispirillum cyanobacteriorum]AUN29848.1 hypothetical protein C0V82_06105 [Niveispirillum cyanobacteriorum]GGE60216.1 hypothetical protein GCM10011317_17490 [Niveispirillum cyanobacteriorum]